MKPLKEWTLALRKRLVGVFTDIDDTLTTDGRITPDALEALRVLKRAGLVVIPITGRPVGWSLPFAATWPVDAIVAENGAVALLPDGRKLYMQDAPTRKANFEAMQRIARRVLAEVPGTTLARDSPGRETDIAFDHSEFCHLSLDKIEAIVMLLKAEGMNATVSSIHVNAWFGPHNKWAGAEWALRELKGRALADEVSGGFFYVGDSTNDQVMFQHFPQSVGVANIRRFEHQLHFLPTYVTECERGAGFAEAARMALEGVCDRALREAWVRCWGGAGAAEERLLDYVRARYSEPHRRYHTLRHLHELLLELGPCSHLIRDERAVLLAIFFHDIEYDTADPTLRSNNEERSAQTFRRECAALLSKQDKGTSALLAEKVSRYILATKHHCAAESEDDSEGEGDLQLFLDMDMSILGQPRARYEEYSSDIRDEYLIGLGGDAFARGRAAALRSFLSGPRPVFGSPIFAERYERLARENMLWEVGALEAAAAGGLLQ